MVAGGLDQPAWKRRMSDKSESAVGFAGSLLEAMNRHDRSTIPGTPVGEPVTKYDLVRVLLSVLQVNGSLTSSAAALSSGDKANAARHIGIAGEGMVKLAEIVAELAVGIEAIHELDR
jgi:hypothetical protein